MTSANTVVSIVVTVFNKAPYLQRVINSLNNQTTHYALELVFVDDASTDESVTILKQAQKRQGNLRIITNTDNAGPAIRLNQGVSAASGDYLLLIDGDDLLSPTTVETMVQLMKNEDADMLFGPYGGRLLEAADTTAPELPPRPNYDVMEHPLSHIIRTRQIGMGVMISRSLKHRFNGCDEGVFVQDISLHLELGRLSKTLIVLHNPFMFGFKDNNDSISTSDTSQGLHDRVLSYYRFYTAYQRELDTQAIKAMVNSCISAMWKYHKRRTDILTSEKLSLFLYYLRNKVGLFRDPDSMMAFALQSFDSIRCIRRVCPTSLARERQ